METTKIFDTEEFIDKNQKETLKSIFEDLEEHGYDACKQIIGYLMSGDPGYISSYKEARNKISSIDRTKILEALVENFVNNK